MAIPEVDDLHDTLMQFAERTNNLICSANSKLESLVSQSPELIARGDDIFGSGATLEEIVTGSSEERSGKKVRLAMCLLQVTSSQLEEVVIPRPGPSLRPVLPIEILDNIFCLLKQQQLYPVLLSNSFLYQISRRRFYHTIVIETPKDCVIFFKKVLSNPELPPLVRSLELSIAHAINTRSTGPGTASSSPLAPLPPPPPGSPGFALPGPSPGAPQFTRNFYALLQRGLRDMHSLVSLTLELPKSHSPFWIFRGCKFKLRQLTTSMHCHRPLATFLESQATIEELTLRGFQNESLFFLPFLGAAAATLVTFGVGHTQGQNPTGSTSPYPSSKDPNSDSSFTLSSTALPLLKSFNAIHAGPSIIHTVMEGRSVEVASIPLFPERSIPTLSALGSGKTSLKRLSVISFDPGAPEFLFEELSTRFRDLEALHTVMLMADYTRVGPLPLHSCVITVPEFLRRNSESSGGFGTNSIQLLSSKSVA